MPAVRPRFDQTGSIAPIMAVAITGLLAASLWGANTAAIAAARRETKKAADLSALAGAANIPLSGAFASGEPVTTACAQAEALLTVQAAPLANRLAATKVGPTCAAGVTVEPLADWTTIETVHDAIDRLITSLGLQGSDMCSPLVAGAIDPVLLTLSEADCAQLRDAVRGMPANLSPATVTPRVRVTISDVVEPPVPALGFQGTRTIRSVATARRRIKNAIVLPAVHTASLTGLPSPVADMVSGVPMPLDRIDPNDTAGEVRDLLVPRLREANANVGGALAPFLPAGVTFDLSQAILDLQDVYDPPRGGSAPAPGDVLLEAARTGDPVVIFRLFRLPVLGIPALDFTAAYVESLTDGTFRATPIPVADLTQARGLFGGSLVG